MLLTKYFFFLHASLSCQAPRRFVISNPDILIIAQAFSTLASELSIDTAESLARQDSQRQEPRVFSILEMQESDHLTVA